MTFPGGQTDSAQHSGTERGDVIATDATVITGQPRQAPAAAGTGVPADADEAYRRGLCVDCKSAWHGPGQPRCDNCHGVYVRRGRTTVSTPAQQKGRGAA